jgi:hypothetical protein
MSEPLPSTWATRELLILRAALRRLDEGSHLADLEEIRQETGLAPDQVWAALRALEAADPPYVEVDWSGGWRDDRASGAIRQVSERARRELGTWPSADAIVSQLVDALAQAAEKETEPERKGRLRAAADAIGGIARDVAVRVIADRIGQF